jgi:hypothetical protein
LAPPRIASARRPARFIAAVGAVCVLAVGLTACGDSSSGSGSTSTNGQQANAQPGAFSDPKVQACVKKQGVQVPDFRRGDGNGPPQNGQPPTGTDGQPPTGTDGQPPTGTDGQPPTGTDGQPPSGQRPPNGGSRNSAQVEKIRKALQKCGVTLPNRGQNSPPQQQGTTQGDTANS